MRLDRAFHSSITDGETTAAAKANTRPRRNLPAPFSLRLSTDERARLSDNPRAFGQALRERGFWLAKGDRRVHVVLDYNGEVYALARQLDVKAKDIRARLGDGDDLQSVDETKALIGRRMTPAIRRHIEEARTRFHERSATFGHAKMQMTHAHRDARTKLDSRLQTEWQSETRDRAARLPTGMRGLWHRITGQYQAVRAANERDAALTRDRHGAMRQALIDAQREKRAILQGQFRELRARQAAQLLELRADIGRYLAFSRRNHDATRERDLGRESRHEIGRDIGVETSRKSGRASAADTSRTQSVDRPHRADRASSRSLGLKLER